MGNVASRDIYSNKTGPNTGTGLDTLVKNQGAMREGVGMLPPKEVTILDGAISGFEEAALIVDTEGGGAADDLEAISPVISATENLHNGMLITLRAKDPARAVTVKNSAAANGINTADGNDIVLSTAWELTLRLVGGRWYEVPGRASAQAAEALSTAEDAQDDAAFAQSTAAAAKAVTDTATATPTPNVVPIADADGTLDNWSGVRFATCATASATAAKVAVLDNFELQKGSRIFVSFANANSVSGALTLNVNSTGAKSIYNEFGAVSASNMMAITAGMPIEFVYDGTNWAYQASGGAYDYIGNSFRHLQPGTSTVANINTQIGTGVGSWMSIAAGTSITLPSGGTWFYWVFGNNGGSGLLNAGGNAMGVVAGGAVVPCATAGISGFAIRIA